MVVSRRAASGAAAAALLLACAAVLLTQQPAGPAGRRLELVGDGDMIKGSALPSSWLSSSDNRDSPLLHSSDEADQVLSSTISALPADAAAAVPSPSDAAQPAAAEVQPAPAPHVAPAAPQAAVVVPAPAAAPAAPVQEKAPTHILGQKGGSSGQAATLPTVAAPPHPAAATQPAAQAHHEPAPTQKMPAVPVEHNIRSRSANGHPPGWKNMVKAAEAAAKLLAERHPRAVLGAHWRDGGFSTSLKQIMKEDSVAAAKARMAVNP